LRKEHNETIPNLIGCIRKFTINDTSIDLMASAKMVVPCVHKQDHFMIGEVREGCVL
jgi:hypothetical protein